MAWAACLPSAVPPRHAMFYPLHSIAPPVRPKFGIIGGSGLSEAGLLEDAKPEQAETPYGKPSGPLELGTIRDVAVAFLPRHGRTHAIPPHRIPHRANLWALKSLGVEGILGTSSVGSLHLEIRPRTFVTPDDFVSLWDIPTFFDDKVVHATPRIDEELRKRLYYRAHEAGENVRSGGVYVQTRGPRLETRAEIRILKGFGDVVGMTMGSEATLASELEIPYACLCSVDNYCHGIVQEPLTYEQIVKVQAENVQGLRTILASAVGGP